MTVFDLCQRWRAGETMLKHNDDLFLLGRKRADVLKLLGDDLVPINREYFTGLHARGDLPLIMNYYDADAHSEIKRKHLALTRQQMGDGFSQRLVGHAKRIFEAMAQCDEVDLVAFITESVIDFHLREFLDIDAPLETVKALAYFEDYFTMGLYLPPSELPKYYEVEAFAPHRQAFTETAKLWSSQRSLSAAMDGGLDLEPHDFFYNFSAAGSTNVAKAFVYGLKLLQEQEQDRAGLSAEALLNELLRFLPLVDNHVVPCFVTRCPTDAGRARLSDAGYGDVRGLIYVFHALHHADPERFELPNLFNPQRWSPHDGPSNLLTFGVGAHACCGSRLAETWLRTLFEVWLDGFHLATPLQLLSEPFVSQVLSSQRLTSRVKIATHKH
jgi:cytochrome P450